MDKEAKKTNVIWKIHQQDKDIYFDYNSEANSGALTVLSEDGQTTYDWRANAVYPKVLKLLVENHGEVVDNKELDKVLPAKAAKRDDWTVGVRKIIQELRSNAFGGVFCPNVERAANEKENYTGYRLNCISAEIVDKIPERYNEEKANYCKALYTRFKYYSHKDNSQKDRLREKCDVYIIPRFVSPENEPVTAPFSEKNFRLFIQADSGFGKTTLLETALLLNVLPKVKRWFSDEFEAVDIGKYDKIRTDLFGDNKTEYFPVYIIALNAKAAVSENDLTVDKRVEKLILSAENSKGTDFFDLNKVNEAHENKSLLFLIDAFDEIPDRKEAVEFQKLINALAAKYKNASIVVTSRYLGSVSLDGFEKIGIGDYEFEAEKPLIEAILNSNAAPLISIIESNDYYRELVKNPGLLLKTIDCFIKDQECTLTEVLERSRREIIQERTNNQSLAIGISDEITNYLGELALNYIFRQKTSTKFAEFRALLSTAIQKVSPETAETLNQGADLFARELASHSGILNLMVDENGVEEFVFQDRLIMLELGAERIVQRITASGSELNMGSTTGADCREAIQALECVFVEYTGDKNAALSNDMVEAIALMAAKVQDSQRVVSPAVFVLYLVLRQITTIDETERKIIQNGYDIIFYDKFGKIAVANRNIKELLQRFA